MATEKDPPYTEIQFFACAEERCFYEKTTVRQPDCNSCRSAKVRGRSLPRHRFGFDHIAGQGLKDGQSTAGPVQGRPDKSEAASYRRETPRCPHR